MVLPPPFHASVHPSASGSPLSGLQHLARKFEKETKDLDSIEVFLLQPQKSGARVQERLMGEGAPFPSTWPRPHLSAVDWPKEPCMWP